MCLQCRRLRRCRFDPWVGKILWSRTWQPAYSILAAKIPWTEKPCGLQFMGLQRVGHNWVTEHSLAYNVILVSGVQQWFAIFMRYEMITIIYLVAICHHSKLLWYYWLYSLSCTLHPCDLFIFKTGSLCLLTPFTYFAHFPALTPSINPWPLQILSLKH